MKAPATVELRPATDIQKTIGREQLRRLEEQPSTREGKFQRKNERAMLVEVCRDLPTECWYG